MSKPDPAIDRPSMVAWVVNTAPTLGACSFRYSRPPPHIHSWKWASTGASDSTSVWQAASITSPQAVLNMTGST